MMSRSPVNQRPAHLAAVAAALWAAVALGGCGGVFDDDETYHPPHGEGPWILVDLYHARKQNHQDYRLSKGDYAYQGDFGFYRAFDHLHKNGYKSRSIRTMPLSKARLDGFDVLFINLVDDTRPDFSAKERRVIRRWVADGGGLFVIGDHTNVYHSSQRLNPLLEPMGVRVSYHTAIDYPPEHSVAGLAWIMVFDFDTHYVTGGVDMVSLQTGAPVMGDGGIARISDQGFGDFWDESSGAGFYGNWEYDGDADREPRGRLPVVQATDYGAGRVVVAGDQNMFGDAWLFFGQNFDLFMNGIQWLAGKEDTAPLRDAPLAGLSIGLDMSHDNFNVGRTDADGYYVFYVNLNRDHAVTAHARTRIDTHDDVLMLMDPAEPFDQDSLERVGQYFQDGKTVVVSLEADRLSPAADQLLAQIAPEFSVTVDGAAYGVSGEGDQLTDLTGIPHTPGALAVHSDQLDVDGLDVSALSRSTATDKKGLSPYLLEISSKWGDPIITAGSGEDTVDIARRKAIGDGELIVVLQDGFWRNRTLGSSETTPPTDQNEDAVELEYRLLDYLKQSSH